MTRLRILGLPAIESLDDLSHHLRLSKGKLRQLSMNAAQYYRVFEIPKKSGGTRQIAQPNRDLKAVQAWILNRILTKLRSSEASTGFDQGLSIADNARPHIGARVVANLDLEGFFPSVPAGRVFRIFEVVGYSKWIAYVLTSLTTFEGGLPQGAPSSPKLANLVCLQLDGRLLGYLGRRGIAYTRYADDMTLSCFSVSAVNRALPFARRIIQSEGFRINESKTRIAGPARAHRVTGLVLRPDGVGIGRKKLRLLRSKIYNLSRASEDSDLGDSVAHLRGWLAFVKSVDPDRHASLCSYVGVLRSKTPATALELL